MTTVPAVVVVESVYVVVVDSGVEVVVSKIVVVENDDVGVVVGVKVVVSGSFVLDSLVLVNGTKSGFLELIFS